MPARFEMGQAYTESLSHIRSIRHILQNGMSLSEASQSILKDEKAIGEEYVTLLHSKVRLIEEEDTALRRILADIALDEEKHQELLNRQGLDFSIAAGCLGFLPEPMGIHCASRKCFHHHLRQLIYRA